MKQILQENKRKDWIDSLRGMAMILVFICHYLNNKLVIMYFITPVLITLFFAITGYTFNRGRTEPQAFIKNLCMKLVFPWIVLTLPLELIASIWNVGGRTFKSVVYNFLSGKNLWFLPCLIIAEIIWFLNSRLTKNLKQLCVVTVFVSVLGFVLSYYDILTFFMINRALSVQVYLLIGLLIRQCENKIKELSWFYSILGVLLYLLLVIGSIYLFNERYIDVNKASYPIFPYSMLLIMVGCFSAFSVAMKIKRHVSILIFIGRNTLVFYTLNGYVSYMLNMVLGLFNIEIQKNILTDICIVICICFGCSILAVIINRFAPWAVGKKKKV